MPASLGGRRSAAIRVAAKADGSDALDTVLQLTEFELPHDLPPGSAVVEIRSAGVNPSDVRAVLGGMPHAVWPRTPGRDYAGVVVGGRRAWSEGRSGAPVATLASGAMGRTPAISCSLPRTCRRSPPLSH
jgi:NADPH:quinone reductase-like Zn-dependent oxidoreductase